MFGYRSEALRYSGFLSWDGYVGIGPGMLVGWFTAEVVVDVLPRL